MKKMELMMLVGAVAVAAAFARADEPLSDAALKENIVRFVTLPGRMCGHALVDFREEFRNRKLTNRAWFDGDTNRLARLIAELAQTNDVELSSQMVETLGEYGTVEQLPFLYSCATNPAVGDLAVRSVFNIEGITSNSLEVARQFLSQTNGYTLLNADARSSVCMDMLKRVFSDGSLTGLRTQTLAIATDFAEHVNTLPKGLDTVLVAVNSDFRFSKRRLAILRAAKMKLDAEFLALGTTDEELDERVHIYNFQTNYLFSAINELVAYPESELPD